MISDLHSQRARKRRLPANLWSLTRRRRPSDVWLGTLTVGLFKEVATRKSFAKS